VRVQDAVASGAKPPAGAKAPRIREFATVLAAQLRAAEMELARFSHQPFLTSSKSEKAKVWRNCREFEKRKK
jgi:hypothetical protein